MLVSLQIPDRPIPLHILDLNSSRPILNVRMWQNNNNTKGYNNC